MYRARVAGVGWSKTRVAGRRRPVTVDSRLRSSTAVSESKPRSWKACAGCTARGEECPSTAATSALTSSRRASSRSSPARPARRSARDPVAARRAVPRVGTRTSPRSRAGTVSAARLRRAAVSRRTGTSTGSSEASAASNSRRPSSVDSGRTPERAIRDLPASSRASAMAPSCSHRPHASETVGRPWVRRCRAKASRKALAAA